ncbi:MAG: hypothetical protein IKA93_00025 [Elusimicrobiaceae bacterium]|nr:hypothetical protein [Elusimicrobiaceae bacterium]
MSDNGITIGQLTEALNNKFDLPAGVPQDAIDYVVEFKRPTAEDPTWYRKYKSGWLEQGGYYGYDLGGTTYLPADSEFTISLLLPYKDATYYFGNTLVAKDTNPGVASGTLFIINTAKTTASIQLSTEGVYSSHAYGVYWEAKGQGAE